MRTLHSPLMPMNQEPGVLIGVHGKTFVSFLFPFLFFLFFFIPLTVTFDFGGVLED